jgi:hypothetical protein
MKKGKFMKKIVIGTAIAIASVAAFAGDVTVSAVRDYKSSTNGVRIQTALPVAGLKVSVTNVEQLGNRVAVGRDFELTTLGPIALGTTVAAVYQNSAGTASNGYGLTVGPNVSYAITKNIKAVVAAERFIGQDRVSQFNGNVTTVGLNVKF